MRKRGYVRLLRTLLGLSMLIALFTACSNANNNEATESTQQTPAVESGSSKTETPAAQEEVKEELITVTFRELAAGSKIDAITADQFEKTAIGKYMKDKFNIRLEQLASSANDNMGDFVRDIASGQMADIVSWNAAPGSNEASVYMKAAAENQLADLAPYIDRLAPLVKGAIDPERLDTSPEMTVYPFGLDQGVYALPRYYRLEPWVSGWGFFLRGDLAGQLGITMPYGWFQTPEEFYDFLVKIKQLDLKDANGNRAWPLGAIASWARSFTYAFDFGGSDSGGGTEIVDGKVVGLYETEWPWKRIEFVRKLIDEQLLDPEIFTQNQQIALEKVQAGKYGITSFFVPNDFSGWDVYDAFVNPGKPEWAYQLLGRMANHKGDLFVTNNKGIQNVYMLMFRKDAPVERIIKLFEWAQTDEGMRILNFGPDEAGYAEATEGGFKWKDDVYEQIRSGGEFAQSDEYKALQFTKQLFTIIYGTDAPETNRLFGGPAALEVNTYLNNPDNVAKNKQRDRDALLMFGNRMEIHDKTSLKYVGSQYPDIEKLDPILNNPIFDRAYLAKSDAEAKKILDDYVKSLMDNGYKDYLAYIQSVYDQDPDNYIGYISPDMQ